MVKFKGKKVSNFNKPNMSIFLFMNYAFKVLSGKPLCNQKEQVFFTVYSVILDFTFSSTIYFKLVILYGVR